jgi:hypothetical protein
MARVQGGRGMKFAVLVLLIISGCATSREMPRADGSTEYLISCGYLGWYICYDKAKELCPDRYKVLSESEPFYRKELRIACPAGQRAS